jgi:prophage tail gpP-like protein
MSDPLVIKIDDEHWDGVSEALVNLSVENISGVFSLTFPQFVNDSAFKKIVDIGSTVKIMIGGVNVIDGYVDVIRVMIESGNRRVIISGRDKTGDLVDCDFAATPNEWKKQTVLDIIKNLCAPFGISVAASGSAASAAATVVDTYKATEGIAVFSLISQLCVDNSIMPVSTGNGKLTLVRAEDAQKASGASIKNPGNVIASEFVADDTDRFSRYISKGQGIETPEKSLPAFLQAQGIFADSIITRNRTKIVFPENPSLNASCLARAKWEAKYRAGMSRQFTYTVGSFLRDGKKPWLINTLVPVSDEGLKYSGDLYCHEILFKRTGAQDRAMLSLVAPFTFSADSRIEKMGVDI